MSDHEIELWYRIQRYEWAKANGLLDVLFPVVAHFAGIDFHVDTE